MKKMKELWRIYEEIWRNYAGYMKKYEGIMKKYEGYMKELWRIYEGIWRNYEEIWRKYEEIWRNYAGYMKKYQGNMKKYVGNMKIRTLPIYGPWDLEKFRAFFRGGGEGGWFAIYRFRGTPEKRHETCQYHIIGTILHPVLTDLIFPWTIFSCSHNMADKGIRTWRNISEIRKSLDRFLS